MELTRLAGRGEFSTLLGEATLEKDKFLRTIGFKQLAKDGYKALSDESRAAVDAYAAMDLFPMEIAASNWRIFSGKMTASGKALFSGSPDLKPTLPALFYMIRISGGGYDVTGGSLPGVPGIGPLGYNGKIAWSAVNGRGG